MTPVGFAYMTMGLQKICRKVVAVLEGGYDLHALEVSSEAVVKSLMINPNDKESFDNLLTELSNDDKMTLT